jgi:coiled-coil and C2 domain-containing protein 2A
MLEACEKDKQGIPFSIDEHTKAIESLLSGYEMNGFPLCVPFTDKAGVIDAVFATDVHSQGGRETEFAVGVRAEIYPGRVAAIWIYLATLVPKR